MARKVVDTNVAVVANGRDTHVSDDCQQACITFLLALRDNGKIVIDDAGGILQEYAGCLHPAGQPGVGDLFFRHVLDNQGNSRLVASVDTNSQRADPLRGAFTHGALKKFDLDDRVFALTGVVAKAPVATAVDSDWPTHEVGLKACGVKIEYVCGRNVAQESRVIAV